LTASTTGYFVSGTTGFVGIQLASGNFGWICLKFEEPGPNQPYSTLLGTPLSNGLGFACRITVVDWTYETSGGTIHVGDTSSPVPEPSPLAPLAAGAVGIGAFRRRKAQRAKAH